MTEVVDDFIGRKFGKDGQVEVIGWDGERRESYKMYTVRCSVCAEDKELFWNGLFKSSKGHLVNGHLPCGCSKQPRWSEAQNIIRVKRNCAKMNYEFLCWAGEYTGTKTKLSLKCLHDGFEWDSVGISDFLTGHGCPMCCGHVPWTQEQREEQIKTAMVGTKLSFVGWVGEYTNKNSKFTINCSEHRDYDVSVNHFIHSGARCPSCATYGFDPSKQANIYVLSIVSTSGEGGFTGYGISNDVKTRLATHKRKLKDGGYETAEHKIFTTTGQNALDIENAIKDNFPVVRQEIDGFKREATHDYLYQQIIAFVKQRLDTGDKDTYHITF